MAEQRLHDALGDLPHVTAAFAQIGVFDLIELRQQCVRLNLDRPLGVALLAVDDFLGFVRDRRIGEDHEVHVDEADELGRRGRRHQRAHGLELLPHGLDRAVEACDLVLELLGWNQIVRRFELCVADEVRVADGDAAGHRDAVQGERHYSSSPKRSAINLERALKACSSSGPSVSTMTVEPFAAASIMTPMMLFAFTRRPLRLSQTALSKRPAVCVSFADARA